MGTNMILCDAPKNDSFFSLSAQYLFLSVYKFIHTSIAKVRLTADGAEPL